MSDFSKRYVIRRAYPTAYDDVVFVSEKTMRDILSEDLTKVEKRYNQSLNYLALDNDMLALNLKNKTNDYDRLNKQYKAQQLAYETLEQQKKALERKLDAEIRNGIQLTRELSNLRWAKRDLQEYVDRIQSQHVDELRKLVEKRQ